MKFRNITLNLFLIIFFSQFFSNLTLSEKGSFILLKIDNQIITNIDVENEKNYLLAINENLSSLSNDQIFEIAKDSLIREKIKKNELEKFFDVKIYSSYIDGLLEDFQIKLGFKDAEDLEQYLFTKDLKIETVKFKLNIEALWNQLIYSRYNNQIEIDENKLKEKIKNVDFKNEKKLISISEIIFLANTKLEIEETYKKIINSINDIGFANTANIYSISETAKFGGEIGWVNSNQLSSNIAKELKHLKVNEYTKLINVPGGFLILKINDKKIETMEIDPEKELKEMIVYEKDRQFNEFSSIYFQKIKKNSLIDEK